MASTNILIIDDEPDLLELLELTISRMGLQAHTAVSKTDALHQLSQREFDLCLTDMSLPDGNGMDILRYAQKKYPLMPLIMITAHGSLENAIEAMKAGAFDFLAKPVDLHKLRALIGNALTLKEIIPEEENPLKGLIGTSPAMQTLQNQIRKLARSQAPVFIHGESGSGKELVAQAIHGLSGKAAKPFVAVNCGAIPSELMESEFFGHKKGSFTGAIADKEGFFAAASGGTLFLDEVADLPLNMQVKLLRAIQENKIRPVGSEKEISVDIRLISASHKNLEDAVNHGDFRQDLYYRLNVIDLAVPALRERKTDIPVLINHFLQKNHQAHYKISEDAQAMLAAYNFPGNVRELENILQRAVTLCDNNEIHPANIQLKKTQPHNESSPLPSSSSGSNTNELPKYEIPAGHNLETYLEEIERSLLLEALESCRWNRTAAAEKLGISFRSIRYRLKKLNID